MYTRYFGLSETPFAISPNPRYLYMSELHREALAHLLYGLNSDGCIILLTGDIGTGKTTLCRCLLEKLPDKTDIAVILNPRLTARDLLKTICEEFGILPSQTIASSKTYLDTINQYLLRAHAEDRTVALIIDEAQNLDISVLEQLRLLTNLETTTKKLLRIILVGQPELREMLERPELIQVNQRITSRYHLSPLEATDVRKYIQHRLNVAGDNSAALFTDKAIKHAITLTGGIPRLINVLCDRALLGAYAVNSDHVDLEIMKRAGKEVFPNKRSMLSRRNKTVLITAALLTCLAIPALVFIPGREEKPVPPEPPTPANTELSATENIDQAPLPQKQLPQETTTEAATEIQPVEQPQADPQLHAGIVADERVNNTQEESMISAPLPKETSPAPSEVALQEPTPKESTPASLGSADLQSAVEQPVNSIHISAPLLVLEKAGPIPQKTAEEIISK